MGYREMRNRKVVAYAGPYLIIEFEMDRAGWRKIAVSPDLRDATTAVVRDRALPYAKQISPYDPRNRGTPHYRDSFVVRQGYDTINELRRVSTRLFNVSDHATEVEFLNDGKQGGPLRRTISYLIHESVLEGLLKGFEDRDRQQRNAFKPEQHPRGARGRFIPRRR